MKHAVLSADGGRAVYLVPDKAADNPLGFCLDFVTTGCNSARGRRNTAPAAVTAAAGRPSSNASPPRFAGSLGRVDSGVPLPGKYRDCPEFNF